MSDMNTGGNLLYRTTSRNMLDVVVKLYYAFLTKVFGIG